MAKLISTPLQIGYDLGEAAVTGGASAAVDAGKAKAIAAAKEIPGQVAQGVGQVAAEKYYEAELVRAESAQKIAATLTARATRRRSAATRSRTPPTSGRSRCASCAISPKRFDEVQQTLRRNIQDVGRAADAAGLGKEFGARYKMIAEFRAEATLFVNEADLAIKLGEENVSAMNEGNERRKRRGLPGRQGHHAPVLDTRRAPPARSGCSRRTTSTSRSRAPRARVGARRSSRRSSTS